MDTERTLLVIDIVNKERVANELQKQLDTARKEAASIVKGPKEEFALSCDNLKDAICKLALHDYPIGTRFTKKARRRVGGSSWNPVMKEVDVFWEVVDSKKTDHFLTKDVKAYLVLANVKKDGTLGARREHGVPLGFTKVETE